MKRTVIISLLLIVGFSSLAQESINNYKYIIVPQQYEFSTEKDQYRINTLTRVLFKGEGFIVYYDLEDLPEDLREDNCLGLYLDLKKIKGGIFTTKMKFVLKNCFGKTILESGIGESREKEYQVAYNEAIRHAFESFEGLNYTYEPTETAQKQNLTPTTTEGERKNSDLSEKEAGKTPRINQNENPKVNNISSLSGILYAQPIKGGYQLVNSEPKVVMVLLETSSENVFLVKGKTATVLKKNGEWIYSENDGDSIKETQLNIKF